MTKPVINIADIEFKPRAAAAAVPAAAAERFEATFARIGPLVGARQLGYNITAVPPGKRAFPRHSHRVNEEMFFVLHGTGAVKIGADTYPLRPGDIVSCLAGGPETAHQIINTGHEELRYLAVSTQRTPEIWEYLDSGKFGVIAEFTTPGDPQSDAFPYFGHLNSGVGYWDSE
jgi:uncharacterized cupin superfamily protein